MGRRGVQAIRHNIPPRNKNFTGREDILGQLRDPCGKQGHRRGSQ